jgi:hypothetical protein
VPRRRAGVDERQCRYWRDAGSRGSQSLRLDAILGPNGLKKIAVSPQTTGQWPWTAARPCHRTHGQRRPTNAWPFAL